MIETPLQQQPITTTFGSKHGLAEPFVFVPITGNEAARGRGATKRIVRAHVTRVQHAKSTALSATQELQTWTVKPYVHRDTVPIRRKVQSGEPKEKKKQPKPKAVSRKSSESTETTASSETSSTKEQTVTVFVPKLGFRGGSSEDPFWSYPVDYQPELSPLFAHYVQNIAVDIVDLDGPNEKGLIRKRWFPLIMTEAAPMYAVLLMAASHYAIVNPKQGALIDLLHLKARALQEINNSLADPKRAVTDAMIGAVAKMAAYEAIFGDSATFAAHMRGLQMMLKMRGGFTTLGLGGLIERMILWIDLNAAHITGLQAQLNYNEEFPTEVFFAAPDPFHFAGIS